MRRQNENAGQPTGEIHLKIGIGFLCILYPAVAHANPYTLNPSSLISFGVVSSAALCVEAGVVALILAFVGLSPLRMFGGYMLANAVAFLVVFCLLQSRLSLSGLELLIVAIDAVSIKLLSRLEPFQGDAFRNVSWPLAAFTSLTGNAASFCIGLMWSGEPWKVHG